LSPLVTSFFLRGLLLLLSIAIKGDVNIVGHQLLYYSMRKRYELVSLKNICPEILGNGRECWGTNGSLWILQNIKALAVLCIESNGIKILLLPFRLCIYHNKGHELSFCHKLLMSTLGHNFVTSLMWF